MKSLLKGGIDVKKIKMFVVGVIVLFTILSIAYLAYISKQMEKYAVSRNDGRTCYIIYSSSGGKFNGSGSVEPVLEHLKEGVSKGGYDSINLGVKNNIDSNELTKQLLKHMGFNKKYILIDINTTEFVASKKTILIKVSNNASKYKDNLDYSNKMKEALAMAGVKANIITEGKQVLNQDLGYRSIRIEISSKMGIEEAKKLIENFVAGLVK